MSLDPSNPAAAMEAFHERLAVAHLAPLWPRLPSLVTRQPASACRAHRWRYAEVLDAVLEAGRLITAEQAERRVIVLENPGLAGSSRVTTSLYAGLQMVLPGEVAAAHRHAQAAIRLAMDSVGAYTTVDGERTTMRRGDLVLTPPMVWHDHGNAGDEPAVWLDGLDIPLVQALDASFAERSAQATQPVLRGDGASFHHFGQGMGPVALPAARAVSPIVNYPYARARAVLSALTQAGAADPHDGHKVAYRNPLDGGHVLPTMAAFLQLLPARFTTAARRSTDATVFVALEGGGRTTVGDTTLKWEPGDVFVAPSWYWVQHRADEESVLFSFSDCAAQEKLGLWREEREGERR